MKKPEISMKFKQYADAKLVNLCNEIEAAMTNNPAFADLKKKVAEFSTAANTFTKSIPSRSTRNMINTAVKDNNKKALLDVMSNLAYGTMYFANGDLSLLETSNFPLKDLPSKLSIPGIAEGVNVKVSYEPGTIVATCKASKLARMYDVSYTTDKNDWSPEKTDSTCSVTVTGVPTGVILFVKMRLRNSTGAGPWSNPVEIRTPLPNEPFSKRVNL